MRNKLTCALAAALATTALVGIADAQTYLYRHKPALNTTISPADTTPDVFGFPTVSGASRGGAVVSASATPTGYNAPTAVSVSGDGGPQLSLDGGATWASSGILAPGGALRLRLTTDATPSATYTATVVVGATTASWQVTTVGVDTAPDNFAIAAVTGATPGGQTTSAAVTPTGYLDPTTITVSGGGSPQISVAGGAWTTSATISPGQSFQVRLAAASASNGVQSATVTVGGVSGAWSVTTRAVDSTPDAFAIAALTGQAGSTQVTSAAVTPTGYIDPTTISVSGNGSPQIAVAGGAWTTSATISPGQSFQARLTTGPTDGATLAATVTVGGVSAVWNVTTQDTIPAAFAFTDVTGQAVNQLITSAAVTPTGYSTATTASVSGDGSPQIEVNGNGVWTTSATISPGQSLRVRLTSGAAGTTRNATVTVGGVTDTWSVGVASGPSYVGRSCLEGYNNGNRTNGVYTINPSGTPVQVYCDMTGGGWTLVAVQQSGNGSLMTRAAVGTVSSPGQSDPAKIADTDWTAIGTVSKFEVFSGSTFYAHWNNVSYRNDQNYGCDGCNPTPMCSADGSSWGPGRPYHVADCLGYTNNAVGFTAYSGHMALNISGGRAWAR